MKAILIVALMLNAYAMAGVQVFNQADTNLGVKEKVKCGRNVVCSVTSGKVLINHGNQVNPTTGDTLTAAQCGSSIINTAGISINLPEAADVLGCRYRFIVGHTGGLWINPQDNDQIMLLTNSVDDTAWADAVGESVELEAISTSAWAPVGSEKGTWTDAD